MRRWRGAWPHKGQMTARTRRRHSGRWSPYQNGRGKVGSFADDLGAAHRVCGRWASIKYRQRRRAGRFSRVAALPAAGAAVPTMQVFGFFGAGTPPFVPAGLIPTIRGTTCTPDTSSGTALIPAGPEMSLGSLADVSSACLAALFPPLSSDSAPLTAMRLPRPEGQTLGGCLLCGGRGPPGRHRGCVPYQSAPPHSATHGRRCRPVTATGWTARARRSSCDWARCHTVVRHVRKIQLPRQAKRRSWAAGSCKHRRPQFSPHPLCHHLRPDWAWPRLQSFWL